MSFMVGQGQVLLTPDSATPDSAISALLPGRCSEPSEPATIRSWGLRNPELCHQGALCPAGQFYTKSFPEAGESVPAKWSPPLTAQFSPVTGGPSSPHSWSQHVAVGPQTSEPWTLEVFPGCFLVPCAGFLRILQNVTVMKRDDLGREREPHYPLKLLPFPSLQGNFMRLWISKAMLPPGSLQTLPTVSTPHLRGPMYLRASFPGWDQLFCISQGRPGM